MQIDLRSGVAFSWNFCDSSTSSLDIGACDLKSKTTVTFILIATLLNPICCCFADVLSLDPKSDERHECWMAAGNEPERNSPCGNQGECPYKESKQFLQAKEQSILSSFHVVPLDLTGPVHLLPVSSAALSRSAIRPSYPGGAYSTGPPVRLHKAYSVYLL